jgi:hypothetical protein
MMFNFERFAGLPRTKYSSDLDLEQELADLLRVNRNLQVNVNVQAKDPYRLVFDMPMKVFEFERFLVGVAPRHGSFVEITAWQTKCLKQVYLRFVFPNVPATFYSHIVGLADLKIMLDHLEKNPPTLDAQWKERIRDELMKELGDCEVHEVPHMHLVYFQLQELADDEE